MCDAQTWISIADAAILLKVKPATVLRRIEKGTLPARRSVDMPFTYDGKENYEVRLDALSQRLQYQYLYSHLPESDICSLDLISPRSVLGNVWLDEFLDISSLIRDVAVIRQQHHGTGHITDKLRELADRHGISLATLYRLTGKPLSEGISALYTDPFYLRDRLPATMCLWSCDLAFALYLDSDNQYSQNDIMTEFDKLRSSIPCADCPYHPGKSDGTDIPKCPAPHEQMPVPNHRKTINRLLRHIPPQMILYARKGYREWRAQYGLFVMRDRPLLVNESWQGDHHKFDLFVRITIQTEHNGKAYEKEIAVRPTLTGWIDSATSAFVGWVISVTPNSDTIAEAFCRAAVLKPGSPIRGLPKTAIVDCGKDYKSKLLEDVPAELAPWTSDDTELNKRFAGLGLLPALGVEVAHALPYHPQSKSIERCFGILEEKWISKLPGWCRNSIHERPEDFQKTLTALLSDRNLLTLEEFVQHFQNIILPEYHSTVDSETTVPELSGWQLSVSSMTPLQRYNFLEKAKTITPDWSTINILKLHLSSGHKVGRWGIRFSNTYYQADELANIVGSKVDILFHRVQPPYAPSSLTVIHQNRYLCEAYPAERRHMTGDDPAQIVHDSDRHNRPAREMKAAITRIRQSADAIMPDKARSNPGEKNQLSDMVFAPLLRMMSRTQRMSTLKPSPTLLHATEMISEKGSHSSLVKSNPFSPERNTLKMNDNNSISHTDPFDEPLVPQKADRLILNDTFFAAARGAITVDGMDYSFLKPPYAGNYIEMVCREENVQFSYPAQQALIATALNSGIGGINAFTTIIGRCITLARVHYYNLPGHSIPDKAKCVRTEVPGGAAYPGAKLILTLPVTSDPVHISEQMVSDMQSEYKSHFPKMVSSKQRKAPTGSASQEGALSGNTGTQT